MPMPDCKDSYVDQDVQIYQMDAIELLRSLPDKTVDAVITDPPYGTTHNEWDIAPNWKELLAECLRVSRGAVCVFSQMPVAAEIVMADRKHFRYEWVWKKSKILGFLDANRKPMRAHELILVFSDSGNVTYNPQMRLGYKPYSKRRSRNTFNYGSVRKNDLSVSDGDRFPLDVLEYANPQSDTVHPTQKPVDLIAYLMRTFSNEGGTIVDPYMGSGTTAVAAIQEGRHAIGSELDDTYFQGIKRRLDNTPRQTLLPLEA